MKHSLQLRLSQHLTLTPQLQQSIRLLQLSTLELNQEIERMLMDNGSPWGSSGQSTHTRFSAWLMRLGVTVSHGRPYHPQTQGKEERFHRTLKLEVIGRRPVWHDLQETQQAFDSWRHEYNFERPHDALSLDVPASRYSPSLRSFPGVLPPIEYDVELEVRRVKDNGSIKLKGGYAFISKAFSGEPVGLREVGNGIWDVYYSRQRIDRLDLNSPSPSYEV